MDFLGMFRKKKPIVIVECKCENAVFEAKYHLSRDSDGNLIEEKTFLCNRCNRKVP